MEAGNVHCEELHGADKYIMYVRQPTAAAYRRNADGVGFHVPRVLAGIRCDVATTPLSALGLMYLRNSLPSDPIRMLMVQGLSNDRNAAPSSMHTNRIPTIMLNTSNSICRFTMRAARWLHSSSFLSSYAALLNG
jgi:hypothetical protein